MTLCIGMTLCDSVHVSTGSDPGAAAPAGSGTAEDGHDHPPPRGWGTNKKRGGIRLVGFRSAFNICTNQLISLIGIHHLQFLDTCSFCILNWRQRTINEPYLLFVCMQLDKASSYRKQLTILIGIRHLQFLHIHVY